MRFVLLAAVILLLPFIGLSNSPEDSTAFYNKILHFPGRLFGKVNNKTASLDNQLSNETAKYLQRLSRKEARLKQQLYRYDSNSAQQLFAGNPEAQYGTLLQKLKSDSARPVQSMGPQYLPYADSLQGVLSFLKQNPQLAGNSKATPQNIQNALSQYQELQAKMQDADQIRKYIAQRKEQIKEYILTHAGLPSSVNGIYADYNKELYYYNSQLEQYRAMLNDPGKLMSAALSLLNKIPAFGSFMQKNSFLASMFGIPDNYGSAEGLEGLQSRDQVLSIIQSQIGSGGAGAGSALQNSLQTAQQGINNLRDKVSAMGAGSGDMDMPNFKPNMAKTKTFFQRLEYGTNMQTTHASYYYPTTTDLGLSVAYRLGNKSDVGIGGAYKIGWGSGIQHIGLSGQGASVRSFVDVQAKKSFYLSGGFEYNYQLISGQQLGTLQSWQQSGLIGLSKIVSMTTKVFKKTKIQFFWDFLSYQQLPRSQPFKFRVGYGL